MAASGFTAIAPFQMVLSREHRQSTFHIKSGQGNFLA